MANNTIKGLTVEIGGDTTKLGKALEDVNKKTRDLSSELGQINKLLKLDPGNADLLAQKQKVLADAVKNTADKLETLKKAEQQVQEQFKRGGVSEAQVRALQREIVETSNKLKTYERAARETAEQVEKLGRESKDVKAGADDASKGADKAADSLDDMADSASKAGDASDSLGSKLGGLVKGGLKALAVGVTAAVGAMVASAEATRDYRKEMGKLDTAFTTAGHSSEAATSTYRAFQGILGETDQAVEAANHVAKLAKDEEDLATWATIATGVYATFGASLPIENLTEAANETAKLGTLTGGLADAINWAGLNEEKFQKQLDACANEQERQELITRTLNGLYSEAAEKYRETNAEIIRANEANEAWMASMADVGAAVEPILSDVKLLGASLVSDLVPGVQAVADAFRGMFNGDDGAAADLGAALTGIFEQLLTTIIEMLPRVAEIAVSLVTTLTTSILTALPQLLGVGVQVVGTLISGLLEALPQILTVGGQVLVQLLSGIAGGLPMVLQSAMGIIGSFVDGLQQHLPKILEVGSQLLINLIDGIARNLPSLVSQALDIVMQFATTLYDNAPTLIETGFTILSSLIQGILECLPDLLSKGPEIVSKFANIINDNFPMILRKGFELIVQIIQGIISAIPDLVANIPKIITAIVDVWEAYNWLNLGKKAITLLRDGIKNMVGAVKSAGKNVLEGVTSSLKNLPSQLSQFGKTAMTNLGSALKNGLGSVKTAAKNIFDAVINALKSLPSKMLDVGKDVVKGLWNGISDMAGWIAGKLETFGSNVLNGIKDFFGIESPSKVFRDEVGKMLAAGLAEGIERNASDPLHAMADLSRDVLGEADAMNGLTLERKLQNTFAAPEAVSAAETGMLDKLDRILAAIERGQILTIDGSALVGATLNRTDSALGRRRELVARGAI